MRNQQRYFIVHWLGQQNPFVDDLDDPFDDDFEFEDDYPGGDMLMRGKLYIKTQGNYVNEQGLLAMISEQHPQIEQPYVDRVEEMERQDYEDFLRGNPNMKSQEMRDPDAPSNFS